ncbi:MAG TPA: hypothetical protein VMI53_09015 [Opitutaceae bacterium]|nr:hypothetical protein [Opitutaceae bacterium]
MREENLVNSKVKLSTVDGIELCWHRENSSLRWFPTHDFDAAEDQLTRWALSCWPATEILQISYVVYFKNGLIFTNRISCDHFGLSVEGQTLREHLLDSLLFTVGELNPSFPKERSGMMSQGDTAARLNACRILMECELPQMWG